MEDEQRALFSSVKVLSLKSETSLNIQTRGMNENMLRHLSDTNFFPSTCAYLLLLCKYFAYFPSRCTNGEFSSRTEEGAK